MCGDVRRSAEMRGDVRSFRDVGEMRTVSVCLPTASLTKPAEAIHSCHTSLQPIQPNPAHLCQLARQSRQVPLQRLAHPRRLRHLALQPLRLGARGGGGLR